MFEKGWLWTGQNHSLQAYVVCFQCTANVPIEKGEIKASGPFIALTVAGTNSSKSQCACFLEVTSYKWRVS